MLTTIRTSSDCGPYFPVSKHSYQAASLRDVLFHVRLAMEDSEDLIGIFNAEGKCKGIWANEPDAIPDGEGGWDKGPNCYILYRPDSTGAGIFNYMLARIN